MRIYPTLNVSDINGQMINLFLFLWACLLWN